jgi:hypothetical protein
VFRASTATWYVWQSASNSGLTVPFGFTGDIPVPADYDGDGRTDFAVFHPSTGTWYIWQSLTNSLAQSVYGNAADTLIRGPR